MGQRVKRAFDRFMDVSRLSDAEIAARLRALEVDIVVDLMGFTDEARSGVLLRRPAPVQVNYLGYPGSMGAPYIDYILADDFVIPPEQLKHYSERVVHLPDCFQANDAQRRTPYVLTRSECGLPESALVLCCFNNSYKVTPRQFAIWMRLLRETPHALLCMLGDPGAAQRNVREHAKAHGVDPDRLIFAPRVRYEIYLARMSLSDLFLDTLPFAGGTTASDALWAGLPVLTCVGEAFAARMAGSLLRTMGLPELITYSLEEYEQRALELLREPHKLTELRARLAANRNTHPLFNTERFTRHLEAAYVRMWERTQAGQGPESFAVPALDTVARDGE
jgi:predicted O-linked N-acetylglucosamine transferase (SPINDLY family)